MWVTVPLLLALLVVLCRLFRAKRDRVRLLVVIAVGAGLVSLNLPVVHGLIRGVGEPLVEFARQAGFRLGPFLLLAGTSWGLWRLVRWARGRWLECGPVARGSVLLGSVAAGALTALLLRSTPLVSQVTQVAEFATAEGIRAAWDAALAKAGEVFGGGDETV
jgi:hypothetical protein